VKPTFAILMATRCASTVRARIDEIPRGASRRRPALSRLIARNCPPMLPVSVGFPPIAGPSARVLVLGSLPGEVSLQRRQYYAQPRNAFWRIMGDLFGFIPDLPYAARINALIAHDVAVWDVCASAHRSGSLDSAIHLDSVAANDFASFYAVHTGLGLICFNGAKASQLYRTRVMPTLGAALKGIPSTVLPSTSPAHASVPYGTKRLAWEIVARR
jgi:double-stranded uracil-DNA glycosylase